MSAATRKKSPLVVVPGLKSRAEQLLYAPKEYLDFTCPVHVFPLIDGKRRYMACRLIEIQGFDRSGNRTSMWNKMYRLQLRVQDGLGNIVSAAVFGNVWPWKGKKPGDNLFLYAEMSEFRGYLQINTPEIVIESMSGKVVPVYAGISGRVSGERIGTAVQASLDETDEAGRLMLAKLGIHERDFPALSGYQSPAELLNQLHLPKSVRDGEEALRVARDLSLRALMGDASRNQIKLTNPKSSIGIKRQDVDKLIAALPYPLTKDQRAVIEDVVSDLRSPFPMRRLLSGDVNTGKSISFLVPIVAAWMSGANVAIMTPNQLLVGQLAREIRLFFPGVPVCEVRAGGKIEDGVVIGTTAISGAAKRSRVVFDFVVTDEQHKFSVGQKDGLMEGHTNILEASATAIPRTLAVVQFGGMDISEIRERPVKNQVITRVVNKPERDRLIDFIRKVLEQGKQVAVVYPLVEAGDAMSVQENASRWERLFSGKVAVLHGQMADEEKKAAIESLLNGSKSLLVSSTVIEIGVTLPDLKALVVVNAERFGVSQLHQLRGRVARKGGTGYFFLYHPDEIEEDARERMNLLVECSDGFELAERDMDLRGFGDVAAGSGEQTGRSRLLFMGIKIAVSEIRKLVEREKTVVS